MFEVIIASFGYAGAILCDKVVLSKYKVPVMRFLPLMFLFLAAITAPFLLRWGTFPDYSALLTPFYISIFILMIVVAIIWNILYARGIQKEDLHEFELIMLLTPLVTVIFATIFLPAERNWEIFIPGLIAAIALLATRFRSHHVRIGAVAWRTILAMILMSFESILIKELLNVFSPVTLYFIRTLFIAAAFAILYRPKILSINRDAFAMIILSAMFGVTQMVLKFIGFKSLGVIETTMILVLGPILVYGASAALFKEKLYKRDLFAAVTVVLCILYVEFWR